MHWGFYYLIIFGEERQVDAICHVRYTRLIRLVELNESCAMHMMIWINVIFLLMVGAQDTKYV